MANWFTALMHKMGLDNAGSVDAEDWYDAVHTSSVDVKDEPDQDKASTPLPTDTYSVDVVVGGVYLPVLYDVSLNEATTLVAKLEAFRFSNDRTVEFIVIDTSDGGELTIARESLNGFSYSKETN